MRHSPLFSIVLNILLFVINNIREFLILFYSLNISCICIFIGSTLSKWHIEQIIWNEKVLLTIAPFVLVVDAYALRKHLQQPSKKYIIVKNKEKH